MRASLLQVLFTIRSERQLVEHIEYNVLYRWFVGLDIDDPVWDHSTFTQNRDRLLDNEMSGHFFAGVKQLAEWAQLSCKTACKNDQGIGENSVENCPPRYVS